MVRATITSPLTIAIPDSERSGRISNGVSVPISNYWPAIIMNGESQTIDKQDAFPAMFPTSIILFNDKRFSADGSINWVSCHLPDQAFTDGLPVAQGINGQTGMRNTPTVVNAAFYQTQFLDGGAGSLEEQVLGL